MVRERRGEHGTLLPDAELVLDILGVHMSRAAFCRGDAYRSAANLRE